MSSKPKAVICSECGQPYGRSYTAEQWNELQTLRAENERLKRSDRIGSELLEQTRADLHNALADNERLRKALKQIRAHSMHHVAVWEVANEALGAAAPDEQDRRGDE